MRFRASAVAGLLPGKFRLLTVSAGGRITACFIISDDDLAMTRSSRAVASPRVVSIDDFRHIARHRLPKPFFDYLDGGAEGEGTLRKNCLIFNDVTFRPRHAVALANCSLSSRGLGFDLSLPFLLAPVGYSRLMPPGGEVAGAPPGGEAGGRD